MPSSKTIILTGTHQSPIVELIRLLRQDTEYDWNIVFVGRKYNSIKSVIVSTEYDLMKQLNIKFIAINSIKYDRHSILNTICGLPHFFASLFTSYQVLSQFKPDLIVSTGGYISIPILFVGKFMSVRSIIHEQTLTESLSTRLAKYFVTKIALSFDTPKQKQGMPSKKTVVTGNLMRQEIFQKPSGNPTSQWFDKQRPMIFIVGGNQGSLFINKIVLKLAPILGKKYNIVHQTGKLDFPNVSTATADYQSFYRCFEYIPLDQMAYLLHVAQIIVSRSGANICQELVAMNQKAVLIPLPKSQQNEQQLNAKWAQQQLPNQIVILDEKTTNSQTLLSAITTLSKVDTKPQKTINTQGNLKFLKLIHETIR